MDAKQVLDKHALADQFAARMGGVLPKEKIDAAVGAIVADSQSFSATGAVVSFIFYLRFSLNVEVNGENYNFIGNAGGVSFPGGGALIGELWTDDVENLLQNTISFEFQTTAVASNVNFFDGNSSLLGYFVGGAISTVAGVGGGAGTWHAPGAAG